MKTIDDEGGLAHDDFIIEVKISGEFFGFYLEFLSKFKLDLNLQQLSTYLQTS